VAANLLVSAVAIALGTFVAPLLIGQPGFGARNDSAPERRASFVRWYRAFGILLCLAGMLLAVDSIVFSNYQR
jgi:hypothetical protein